MKTLLALTAFAVALMAQDRPFFFLQFTDTQFGMYTGDKSFVQETSNLEFAIAEANRLKPAFVIITGDLVNKPGDAAQIAEYRRIAAKLDRSITLYQLPGNHDVGNVPTPETLGAYRRVFGKDYFSFRVGGFAGVVLNTNLIHSPENVGEDAAKQLAWLKTELVALKQSRATRIVVFQHHPWFMHKAAEPDGYFNIPLARRGEYLEILKSAGVEHVFAGHAHRNAVGHEGKIEMVTSGPVGMPLGETSSGIRVVVVGPSGLRHSYHPLGNVPKEVKVD